MTTLNDVITIERSSGTTCIINLLGATIVSWKVNNVEQLFCSKQAIFDGKTSIRGGIPIVFPKFGPWHCGPLHGFASIVRWNLEKAPEKLANGDIEVVFSLKDTDFTRSMWNFPFQINYTIRLGEKEIQNKINVHNLSEKVLFDFNLLLHTHFNVPDIRLCEIIGLNGCEYRDKTKNYKVFNEKRDAIIVNQWIDNVYQNTPKEHIITNVMGGNKIRILKSGFQDTVIWNPWVDMAKEMNDFGDDEYINMICIEVGYVANSCSLLPGGVFQASQILQVISE